jgi:ADP-ribose pyrophosphatase YjhB (NUDIX family)
MRIAVYPLVFDKGAVLALVAAPECFRLPAAVLRESETIEEAAKRALKKEAAIDGLECQFVGIYDSIDRNPLMREIAAVVLVRSWKHSPIVDGRIPETDWLLTFNQRKFLFDQNIILLEQGIFAPLSKKVMAAEA